MCGEEKPLLLQGVALPRCNRATSIKNQRLILSRMRKCLKAIQNSRSFGLSRGRSQNLRRRSPSSCFERRKGIHKKTQAGKVGAGGGGKGGDTPGIKKISKSCFWLCAAGASQVLPPPPSPLYQFPSSLPGWSCRIGRVSRGSPPSSLLTSPPLPIPLPIPGGGGCCRPSSPLSTRLS